METFDANGVGKLPRNCGKYSFETSLQYCYAYVFERVG